ncbi:hypothetical protein [Sulfuricurvum sp.]|uniref:hypothetical protein n=1 Tax=Sulfuricurvum sp. TaxID=2025608 RepID=UPI002615A3B4|nr:hypothetical protein [Sulfuricurvum sp.]MDD2267467.1 hypothetical protein [Sulfuricurvum sp.]MDD2782812.1 hypothetical protein [Sulfuricurvum sp.]
MADTMIGAQYNSEGMLIDNAAGNVLADATMPKFDALEMAKGDTGFDFGKVPAVQNGGLFDNMKGLGTTLQGIGAIASAAAGVYDAYNKKKYQDKVFGMEEARVNRENARQDKQQLAYEKVFG